MKLAEIQKPIANEMIEFEKKFKSLMKSNVFLLDRIMTYIVNRKGKQIRPMFVFLTAGMVGKIDEPTYRGASLIELLHTATLVHDDVVDDANMRRGFFSINSVWKNKIAVLVGDYLLAKGLLLSVDNKDFQLLQIVSEAVKEMSEGELLQMGKARTMDITEELYFKIIKQKTASLLASCCGVGACSVGADESTIQKLKSVGEKVGMAFQIKDDLFDYGTLSIGKPVGIDIKEKKQTLPLIYALSQSSWLEKKKMIYTIKNHHDQPKKIKGVIEWVKESGGIQYAEKKMQEYYAEAVHILADFPDSEYKTSIQQLIEFTIKREN